MVKDTIHVPLITVLVVTHVVWFLKLIFFLCGQLARGVNCEWFFNELVRMFCEWYMCE
jgi:hypothetical protein